MRQAWSLALGRFLGFFALATLVGLILHQLTLTLIVALSLYVIIDQIRLFQLQWWLQNRSREEPPDYTGVWGDILALVMRIYRRKQYHKRRVVQLVREFRDMTSVIPVGVVLLGSQRQIEWFNRAAGDLLGLRRRQDVGQRIDTLVRHPDFARYLRDGNYHEPVTIFTNSGSQERYLSVQLAVYAPERQLMVILDDTHAVRLETMRKDFVANASHELRSPLTVISGYVDALQDESGLDDMWREPVAEMARQVERMKAVVEGLIELSRLESTAGEAETNPVNVAGMLTLMRKEAESSPNQLARLHLTLDSELGLLGEEAELHSIFGNLIGNALKYTPPSGDVWVRYWVDEQGAHCAVKDSGPGIAAEHLPRLTERFYRIDPSRHRKTGGSGLGLAIVKHALSRHRGRLDISSTEGVGSEFTAHFPLQRVATAQTTEF
jgi:two-component system, OmpR family, phosphate regulon sensor histidine kinase PhoR